MTVPGEFWNAIQPFGQEIYVERGVEYAPGDREFVGLGYHRIEQVSQDVAPRGPVEITALDRIAQLQQSKLPFPLPLTSGNTHRDVFERLVNGVPIIGQLLYPGVLPSGYGMYLGVQVPISWSSYNPDKVLLVGDQIVDGSTWDFLSQLIHIYNALIRFNTDGTMEVYSSIVDSSVPVATLTGARNGPLYSFKRVVKRTDVHNVVTTYGSDPSSITNFIVSFNGDSASPLAWNRPGYPRFGVAPTYYSSPLIQTDGDAILAGEALLRRYQFLPLTYTMSVTCNPALQPNDPIDVVPWPEADPVRVIIDSMTIPLGTDAPGQIITRIPTATEGLNLGLGVLQ